jgi:hypothetical protein
MCAGKDPTSNGEKTYPRPPSGRGKLRVSAYRFYRKKEQPSEETQDLEFKQAGTGETKEKREIKTRFE